jgi:hypothetical protein
MSRFLNTSHGFAEQIVNLEGFLAENWRAGIKTSGNPVYLRPIILTLRRESSIRFCRGLGESQQTMIWLSPPNHIAPGRASIAMGTA